MPLDAASFVLSGLCEIVLPSRTIRLCDGGFVNWPARGTFTAADDLFGSIGSISAVSEAIGDEAPMGQLTLLPPDISAAGELFLSSAQGSPIRFWLAEIDPSTGALVGDPELQFSGFLDTLTLRAGRDGRRVEMTFIAEAERLFWTKEGNVLSPRFHKSVWAGELGLDHATGVPLAVPWGVPGPSRGTIGGGGFGGGGLVVESPFVGRV